MTQPLKGKIIIVTGATGGIGDATVKRYAKDGATVVASGRNADRLAALEAIGPNVVGHPSDVSNEDEAKALIDRTMTQFGKVDVLWNGAGIVGENLLIEDYPLDDFNHVMNVNVGGVFL
ncbi:MAG: SDR family NAD(P)-dependent oxidoreductase, partial [Litoreibacter sp.]|nr:SDR family NAD(P)-dependent oxidoreductase [Litoreibacter sp.]